MANRLTDTDKWKKPWYRKLKPKYKALWEYLRDNCDHAGIWVSDYDLAQFQLNDVYDWEESKTVLSEQIRILENGKKWFIPDFVLYQYKVQSFDQLNPKNPLHKSVLFILEKHNLLGASKGLESPNEALKDKNKDKDEDKNKNTGINLFNTVEDQGIVESKSGKQENKSEASERHEESAPEQKSENEISEVLQSHKVFPVMSDEYILAKKLIEKYNESNPIKVRASPLVIDEVARGIGAVRKVTGHPPEQIEKVISYLFEQNEYYRSRIKSGQQFFKDYNKIFGDYERATNKRSAKNDNPGSAIRGKSIVQQGVEFDSRKVAEFVERLA